MIRLEVKDYCQNCPNFEAETHKEEMFAFHKGIIASFTITCVSALKCECLKKYLKDQEKKNDHSGNA